MTRPAPDYSLYLVTDPVLCAARGVAETVRLAVAGGATVVQVREKNASRGDFIAVARAVKAVLAGTGVPLVINDNLDVALAVEADGIHVGQSDTPASEARAAMGPQAIVGLSVETMAQAAEAETLPVDYLGVSPVFDTPTKTDTAPAWGLTGLAELRAATTLPLVGIGGIGAANAAEVIRAGADGVAVVSAICAAPDPERAARDIRAAVRAAS